VDALIKQNQGLARQVDALIQQNQELALHRQEDWAKIADLTVQVQDLTAKQEEDRTKLAELSSIVSLIELRQLKLNCRAWIDGEFGEDVRSESVLASRLKQRFPDQFLPSIPRSFLRFLDDREDGNNAAHPKHFQFLDLMDAKTQAFIGVCHQLMALQ